MINPLSWLFQPRSAPPPAMIEPTFDTKQVGGGPGVGAGNVVESVNAQVFPQRVYYGSNTGVPVTPFTAMQSAAVYGCCKCIAEDIGGLTLQIRRRLANGKGWVVDDAHPLNKLYRRPNRWQTPGQFWNYILFAFSMRGNSYIVTQRDRGGSAVELVPVSPDRCQLRVSPETGLVWYYVNALYVGFGVWVPQDDMVHVKNMSFDGYLGLSPIACAQDVIGLAIATQQHGAVLFRQGGQIGGIFRHPGRLGKEASDNIAQSFRESHGGVQNAHKALILEEGMTFERPGMTNEDAQFLATRQFQVIDICRLYRVPPHKLGELGRATYGNIEQQQQQYIDDCLKPHTDQLEQLLDEHCLFDDERDLYSHHFDYSSMLRGDQLRRFQAYQIGTLNGWLSRNEVRAFEGMNPVPGGDEYRVPLNTGDPLHPETLGQNTPPSNGNGDGAGDGDDDESEDA
jgi:HK97 family phage portal protein